MCSAWLARIWTNHKRWILIECYPSGRWGNLIVRLWGWRGRVIQPMVLNRHIELSCGDNRAHVQSAVYVRETCCVRYSVCFKIKGGYLGLVWKLHEKDGRVLVYSVETLYLILACRILKGFCRRYQASGCQSYSNDLTAHWSAYHQIVCSCRGVRLQVAGLERIVYIKCDRPLFNACGCSDPREN